MSIYQEDIITVALERGSIHRSFLNHSIGEKDIDGNVFGVRLTRDGNPVDVSLVSCIGYFIRADGETVVINGGLGVNGVCRVILPQSCYAVEGTFSLALKLSGQGVTGTIRIVDGTVINTTTGTVIDPGSVVPDITELLEKIAECEAAAESAFEAVAIINSLGLYVDDEGYVCQRLAGET